MSPSATEEVAAQGEEQLGPTCSAYWGLCLRRRWRMVLSALALVALILRVSSLLPSVAYMRSCAWLAKIRSCWGQGKAPPPPFACARCMHPKLSQRFTCMCRFDHRRLMQHAAHRQKFTHAIMQCAASAQG